MVNPGLTLTLNRGGVIEQVNGSNGPDRLTGNAQRNVFDGRGGNDAFVGTAGNDTYVGGSGGDYLDCSGYRGFFQDADATDVAVGLSRERLSPAELSQTGSMVVSLSGQTLTITGPTGAGFTIVSNGGSWSSNGAAAETITGSGSFILKSAWGDIPFWVSPLKPLTIYTAADSFANAGKMTGGWFSIGFDLSTNSTLKALKDDYGLSLNIPSAKLALHLGSEIDSDELPVNPAVPYLFLKADTGLSVSYADMVSVDLISSYGLTLAFDPGDASLFARIKGLPVVGTLAFGFSQNGYIPFTPDANSVPSASARMAPIYGNVYTQADLDLGTVPVTISGQTVIDLDANDDGVMLNLDNNTFHRLINSGRLDQLGVNVMDDLAVGFNGSATAGFSKGPLSLSLPLGNVTGMFGRDQYNASKTFAFRAKQTDPFAGSSWAGTVGAVLRAGPLWDLDGHFGVGPGGLTSWHFTAGANDTYLGVGLLAKRIDLTVSDSGISANARVNDLLNVSAATISGNIGWDGRFTLTGSQSFDVRATVPVYNIFTGKTEHVEVFNLQTTASFKLSNDTGSVYFNASFGFHTDFTVLGTKVSADASGTIHIWGEGGKVKFSGGGQFKGKVGLIWVDVGFGVSNSGFSVKLGELPPLTVSW